MEMVTGSSELLQHAQGACCSEALGVLLNFYISFCILFDCNIVICILTFAMLLLKIYVTILWVIWMEVKNLFWYRYSMRTGEGYKISA